MAIPDGPNFIEMAKNCKSPDGIQVPSGATERAEFFGHIVEKTRLFGNTKQTREAAKEVATHILENSQLTGRERLNLARSLGIIRITRLIAKNVVERISGDKNNIFEMKNVGSPTQFSKLEDIITVEKFGEKYQEVQKYIKEALEQFDSNQMLSQNAFVEGVKQKMAVQADLPTETEKMLKDLWQQSEQPVYREFYRYCSTLETLHKVPYNNEDEFSKAFFKNLVQSGGALNTVLIRRETESSTGYTEKSNDKFNAFLQGLVEKYWQLKHPGPSSTSQTNV